MLYNHPFTDWVDLLSINGQVYRLYIDAFQAYRYTHMHLQDFYTNLEAEYLDLDNESEEDPQEEANNNYPLADFEAFTHWRPQEDFTQIDLLNSLGTWEMDWNYN
jgi:hypothetical protein